MKFIIKIFFFYSIITFSSKALELKGNFYQGNLIIGKTDPGSKIFIDNKIIKVSNDGYFAFGLSKDRNNDVIIKIINQNKTEEIIKKVYKKNIKYKK